MTILQSIFLGILQGIAEFLPISSSGHLAVVQHLFNIEEVPLLFDVILHLATLAAVIIFFRKKIWTLLCVFFRVILRKPAPQNKQDPEDGLTGNEELSRKTIVAVIIATFITAAIGIVTSKCIPELPVKTVCAGFIVTALMLVISEFLQKKKAAQTTANNGISVKQSAFIGLLQGIGTLPGISRSGSTITGAILCGVDRKDAGEFSFIVSIPAVFGAFLLEAKDLGEVTSTIGAAPLAIGCIAAFISGYAALAWLMKLIKKGKLSWFACYLVPAGILGLLFL